jgi:hemerythrin superfamily protein
MADQSFTDAIALLKADHRKVEDLFADFEKAPSSSKKRELAHQICVELKIHTMIEEEIFYPALRGKIDGDDLDEAYVEHDGAKVLIAEISSGGPQADEYYDAKVKVLQEEIEHHVEEEEKRMEGLFAQARKAGLDMDALGEQLAMRKLELTEQFKTSGLPKPELKTMDSVGV